MRTVIIRAEGDMGAGKSVVLNIIAEALAAKGFDIVRSRNVPTIDPYNVGDLEKMEIRLDEIIR